VIIVDSTDPVGPAAGLFSETFYRNCHRALRPRGIVVGQSECRCSPDLIVACTGRCAPPACRHRHPAVHQVTYPSAGGAAPWLQGRRVGVVPRGLGRRQGLPHPLLQRRHSRRRPALPEFLVQALAETPIPHDRGVECADGWGYKVASPPQQAETTLYVHPRNRPEVALCPGAGARNLLVVCLRPLQDPTFCDGSHKGSGFTPVKTEISQKQQVALCGCKRSVPRRSATVRTSSCDAGRGRRRRPAAGPWHAGAGGYILRELAPFIEEAGVKKIAHHHRRRGLILGAAAAALPFWFGMQARRRTRRCSRKWPPAATLP